MYSIYIYTHLHWIIWLIFMVLFCREFFPVRSQESGHGNCHQLEIHQLVIHQIWRQKPPEIPKRWLKKFGKIHRFFCLLEIHGNFIHGGIFVRQLLVVFRGEFHLWDFFFRCFHRKNDDIPNEPRREKRPSFFSLPKSPRVRHQRRHLATGWFVYTRLCRDEQVRPGWHDSKMVELGTSHFP